MYNLERMHPDSFDWIKWVNFDISIFKIEWRQGTLIKNREMLQKYAIGYCEGKKLLCRPKKDTYAVMFLKDNNTFWVHFTYVEFMSIFKE